MPVSPAKEALNLAKVYKSFEQSFSPRRPLFMYRSVFNYVKYSVRSRCELTVADKMSPPACGGISKV